MARLEAPECRLGYTEEQLQRILGDRYKRFMWWMGQTMAICDGHQYNYDKQEYEETNCGPHGTAVYPWDLQRFLDGQPIVD